MNVRNSSAVWKMYRTRFLVKARQLSSSMVFVDALGREQRGQAGDYLVEASDGSRSIQRRQIFEDVYVAMGTPGESASQLRMSAQPERVESRSAVFGAGAASELAAKRRQNKTQGASRGSADSQTSPRRTMSDHKSRASNRTAATA